MGKWSPCVRGRSATPSLMSSKAAMAAIILGLLTFAISNFAVGQNVNVTANMRSFSSAIKGGHLDANTEKTLYEHNTGQRGVITEQWFTGLHVMDERARIRIYIDNETQPSLDFQLLLAHGIGFTEDIEKAYIPWGTKHIGHTADGGIYNTYRIPFMTSFKVTATHPVGGMFFYIIRGVENYPLRVGDLILPAKARLRLYKTNVTMTPNSLVSLAKPENSSGFLFQVTLAAHSSDFNYLQACMRVIIDGSKNTTYLSSGTEDFFLSAYYFDKGIYHTDDSGLTHKDNSGSMSAYKFFTRDPILYTTSLELMWRCGETTSGDGVCPNDWPPPQSSIKPVNGEPSSSNTTLNAYVWIYEYTLYS